MTSDGHENLAAALDARSLSFPVELSKSPTMTTEVDPDSPPETTFPQSVASGGPEPTGVVLWTPIDPRRIARPSPWNRGR